MKPNLKLTLPIVFAAAVAGAIAGGVVGLLLDGHSTSGTIAPAAASAAPVVSTTSKSTPGLSPEAIYRRAAPAVVVIPKNSGEPNSIVCERSEAAAVE